MPGLTGVCPPLPLPERFRLRPRSTARALIVACTVVDTVADSCGRLVCVPAGTCRDAVGRVTALHKNCLSHSSLPMSVRVSRLCFVFGRSFGVQTHIRKSGASMSETYVSGAKNVELVNTVKQQTTGRNYRQVVMFQWRDCFRESP